MRAESISSSLIILFVSIHVFVLANTQSSSVADGSPVVAAAALAAQDEGVDRKLEEDHADGESSVDDDDSIKFISPSDKRRIGSEFLGKRTIPNFHDFTFQKRRALGSEFLGKRKLGSEFLGKRSGSLQQHPEDYQYFYSNAPENEDDSSPIHKSMQQQQYPTTTRYATKTQSQQYYQPNPFGQASPLPSGGGAIDAAWMNKLQSLKRGLGSEFLGKRDVYRPSSFNLINKWTRSFGARLPIEHDKKRKLMGSEFLG